MILLEFSPDSDFLVQLNKGLSEDVKSSNLRIQYLVTRFNAVNKDLEAANRDLEAAQNKLKEMKEENDGLRQQNRELQEMKRELQDTKPSVINNNNNNGDSNVVQVITLD